MKPLHPVNILSSLHQPGYFNTAFLMTVFIFFSTLSFCHAATPTNLSSEYLRVGMYDNPPKLYFDEQHQAKGIFPGIIKHIAGQEGWKIKFIPVSFKQGLEGLENGTIDIMQDVAWSKQRSLKYGYTGETVLVSWGRIYKRKGMSVNTLIDLDGKRIACMDGGIYSEGPDGLKNLMKKFELTATFIPVKGYKEVFQAIDQGRADAGIVNRLFGKKNKDKYDIENTPVLISPISIRFAFSKSNPVTPHLIKVIDSHLVQMKKDDNSIYYSLIDEYIREPRTVIPEFLKKLLLALIMFTIFFAALGIISRWQVRKKTAQLEKRDQELAESEKKFRTIFETLQDVYFNTTLSGRIKLISPSIEFFSGYTVQELVGQEVSNFYQNPDDRREMLDQITKTGQVRDYQLPFKKKNQQLCWASMNADVYYDSQGKPSGITGILRDITQQKEAQAQLIKREERFREMARLLPCGIVETDIDLNITYVNQAGLDMFGYCQEDIDNGINGKGIIHPDDWERVQKGVTKHLNGESTSPAEYRMFKKDGSIFIVLWNSTPIINNEQTTGFRGSLVDLTEIKQLQKKVVRSQKLESTGILAGGIAHDFNNILLGLFGNLSLAKNELSSKDPAYKLIEEAEKSMSRAKDLTTKLLTFSQDGDLKKTDITLDQIVRETALFHLAGSNIKINMEKPESLWQINADKGQISQVISNLVLNARQAMPNGGTLSIRMENTVISENDYSSFELDRYVKLSVTDQGIGIPEKYLEKIFDPYFTTKQEGSGLGLAVVHSIILSHHGYIHVNSDPGGGTTFVIYLPIASGKDLVPQRPELSVETDENINPCRILVMDDDPLVREVSVRMLNKLGHTVDLCKDGQSAIDLYQQEFENNTVYDLVILDLTIPGGMGAKDTIKPILAIDPEARVIVASGYSNDPVLSDYAAYGFKATAAKPYTVDKLAHALGQAFEA